jgi:hypothetical protein
MIFLTIIPLRSEEILLDGTNQELDVIEVAELFEDENRAVNIQQILTNPAEFPFVKSTKNVRNQGYKPSQYWLKFTINNSTSLLQEYYLVLQYPLLDSVKLYYKDYRGLIAEKRNGDLIPITARDLDTKDIIFNMAEKPNSKTEYYLSISTNSVSYFPIKVLTKDKFLSNTYTSQLFTGIGYGIFLIISIACLTLFLITRKIELLYSFLFGFFFLLSFMIIFGDAYYYLWPQVPFVQKYILIPTLALTILFGALTSRSEWEEHPNMLKLTTYVLKAYGLIIILPVLVPYFIMIQIISVIGLIFTSIPVVVCCYYLVIKEPFSKIYLATWAIYSTGVGLYMLLAHGFIPLKIPPERILFILSLLGYFMNYVALERTIAESKKS